jgi:hypothetical protein
VLAVEAVEQEQEQEQEQAQGEEQVNDNDTSWTLHDRYLDEHSSAVQEG